MFYKQVLAICKELYPIPVNASSQSYGIFSHSTPEKMFDTIIFFGKSSDRDFEHWLRDFAQHLNAGGNAFLTVNSSCPSLKPTVPSCTVRLIEEIPPNPNYQRIPTYFGVALHKEADAF